MRGGGKERSSRRQPDASACLSSTATTMDVFRFVLGVLVKPKYRWLVATAVVPGDAVLTLLIIRFIPCTCQSLFGHELVNQTWTDTEIDWETYMYHIELYNAGERNYSMITGPTGPLVYVCLLLVNVQLDPRSLKLPSRSRLHSQTTTQADGIRKRCKASTIHLWCSLRILSGVDMCNLLQSPSTKLCHDLVTSEQASAFNLCFTVIQ